jgi:ATP-binding cassette subfamily B protein
VKKNNKMPPRKIDFKKLGRVIKMLFGFYPVLVPVTGICILFSAGVSAIPSLFTKKVIEIIERWVEGGDWASAKVELMPVIITLIVMYVFSVASTIAYTQMMAYITQGFLSKMRCAMFEKMQVCPLRISIHIATAI